MNFLTIIFIAFIFGFVYSLAIDLYEGIKTRVKRRGEKKNDNTPSNVL